MENMKYVYQLSLADGRAVMQETDGFFIVEKQEDGSEKKTLINSTALVSTKLVEEPVVEEEVAVQQVEPEVLEAELV